MREYKINVTDGEHHEYRYVATMDDYDGLADGNNALGVGDTHAEAIFDLLEIYRFDDEN